VRPIVHFLQELREQKTKKEIIKQNEEAKADERRSMRKRKRGIPLGCGLKAKV
jgi:hypothetical protein